MIKKYVKNDLRAIGIFLTLIGIVLLVGQFLKPNLFRIVILVIGVGMIVLGPGLIFKKEDLTPKQEKLIFIAIGLLIVLLFSGVVFLNLA